MSSSTSKLSTSKLKGCVHLTLAILFMGTLIVGIPAAIMVPAYLRHQTEVRVSATGTPAMAQILLVRETGHMYNHRQEAEIVVQVTHKLRGTWKASFRRIMSIQDIQYFVPGRTIEVRFDPADPSIVAP